MSVWLTAVLAEMRNGTSETFALARAHLQPGPVTERLLDFHTCSTTTCFVVALDRLLWPIFSRMILSKLIKATFLEHPQFFPKAILRCLRCLRCYCSSESTDRLCKHFPPFLWVWLPLAKVNSVTVQPCDQSARNTTKVWERTDRCLVRDLPILGFTLRLHPLPFAQFCCLLTGPSWNLPT